ncbi:purine nucleoside permease [Biscogniauxia marginata]|nr:purine nucleoside permease [Biscogniauxia marginata]
MMLSLWNFAIVSASILPLARPECLAQISPKVMIVTFFDSEGDVYLNNSNSTGSLDFRANRYRLPLGNPLFPYLHCTSDNDVCLITTGEGIINAAATTMALLANPKLDLSETYWLLTGIAGGAPDQVTLNSIAVARFSVQASMQHEIDAREIPAGFRTGYFPQGTLSPQDVWGNIYNSEVYELNTELRNAATAMINVTQIVDTPEAKNYRKNYAPDNWFTGTLLATSYSERVASWTNGTGVYCATAQEDGAVLGALVRGALDSRVDFGRIVVVRTVSNFDRPYPGQSAIDNLSHKVAFGSVIANVYLAGYSITKGIIRDWNRTYRHGIPAKNYLGDVMGSLGGEPDFGPGKYT